MAIESINPANGKLLRRFDTLSLDDARKKISIADDAFRAYATVPLEHRALCMRKLASILEHESGDLADLITQEMGKPLHASVQEVLKCATACRYYADNASRILAPESIPTEDNHSYVRYDPLGIVLAVMPWNFPFWQVFRFLAPALMAGNVGLLKHSPNVPQCALLIESLVRRAGFPRGSFQ
ncbi:MAG TPA: aldehyde dehydrogenase family protein, partial [Edaphobacter sp.]|nr:aldehyde dehydrogenase family protein [Edaphobacter sp.]